MAVTITRTAWTDDDGSGTTGTVINNAVKTELYNQIDGGFSALSPGTSTITTTGTQTALALPAGGGPLVIFANNASLLTVQGIAAGLNGQQLTIVSIGAGQVDLAHLNGSASAANRLINVATSGNTSLAAGRGAATYVYDATTAPGWRLDHHEQGGMITPAYASGNFTGNGSMTWTVDAGDVTSYRYLLRGRLLTVMWQLDTTSVGGTLNTTLQIAIPGGFTAVSTYFVGLDYASDNGTTAVAAQCQVSSGDTIIKLFRNVAASGNWAAATNTTTIYGQLTFEVQ
jgi:hypothetical protein